MNEDVVEFLKESNAIEGVTDTDSLIQAKRAWKYLMKQDTMHSGIVLKTHKILMLNQDLLQFQKGNFRVVPVWVGGREGMDFSYIPEAVQVWCYNAWDDPKFWKRHHIRFETIHPFIDGNGRTGRLLMNWQRVKAGLPVLVIKEKEKQEYYKWFK